ncbi:MAG: hypothetical protein QOJ91_2752 [Sphingomonadales bacterium]|jgi:hypothetical protein|nr:hypothetical protein [Sphingomonadales bacterium]
MEAGWPRYRPYIVQSLLLWAFFLASLVALTWGSGEGRWPAAALWALALVQAGSVGLQFALAYRLIARQDEFVRALTAKRMIAAAGLTIALAVLAGLAEQFLGLSHLPMWLVYPLFWGAFGMVTPFIGTSKP